jgi:hypothetical protein
MGSLLIEQVVLDQRLRTAVRTSKVSPVVPRHTLAVSTAVSGVFTGATTVGTATLRQADNFSVRFAITSWLAQGLYIEPAVSFGLAGPGDSFAFGVTIPYSF